MNRLLKASIHSARSNQNEIAIGKRISKVDLSRIATGRRQASEGKKKRLCRRLQRFSTELFGGQEPGDCL